MPTAVPGMSDTSAGDVLQRMDQLLRSFPEVERVFGKAGRVRQPDRSGAARDVRDRGDAEAARPSGPQGKTGRRWSASSTRRCSSPACPTSGGCRSRPAPRCWPPACAARSASRCSGPTSQAIERSGRAHRGAPCQAVPGTRSAFAERIGGGHYLDFDIDRDAAARYGLNVEDVEDAIETAIGGTKVTTTVEGRERYPVSVRYARDFRSTVDDLERVLVATPSGAQIPLGQLADIALARRPADAARRRRTALLLRLRRHRPSHRGLRARRASRRRARRSSSRRDTAWSGPGSTATSSAPRPGWPSSFR